MVGDSVEGKQVPIDLAASVIGRTGTDGGKLRLARVSSPSRRQCRDGLAKRADLGFDVHGLLVRVGSLS